MRVGRGCLGTGLGEVPSSSLASLGLLRASQAEKAMNHEVNWEASPAKTGQASRFGSVHGGDWGGQEKEEEEERDNRERGIGERKRGRRGNREKTGEGEREKGE